jgi:hypothetical protein
MKDDIKRDLQTRRKTIDFFSFQFLKLYDEFFARQVVFIHDFRHFYNELNFKFGKLPVECKADLSKEQIKKARKINTQITKISELYELIVVNYSRKIKELESLDNLIKNTKEEGFKQDLLNNIKVTNKTFKNLRDSMKLIKEAKSFFHSF